MKRIGLAALLSIVLVTAWLVAEKQSTQSAQVPQYICPMHPAYGSSLPGNCPVCGMQLVFDKNRREAPVAKTSERMPVAINTQQQRAIGTELTEARVVRLGKTIHATGRVSLAPPERAQASEAGLVDDVFRMPGTTGALRVHAGEPLLSFNGNLMRATAPLALLSVVPPGQRIEKGKDLYVYTDLATIFVLADIRSSDIPFLATDLRARATMPSYPGTVWSGSVLETASQFDERAQTLRVKLRFPNHQPEVWPGLLASVEIEGRQTRSLAVPESAVVTDGETSLVFVALHDHVFEPRKIETGVRTQSLVEVKRGLSPGDLVATGGTFLLDSESRLRGLVAPGRN